MTCSSSLEDATSSSIPNRSNRPWEAKAVLGGIAGCQ